MKPLVSVIIPTRNAEDYLEKSLDSIASQDLQAFEVLIVDSESSDATVDIAKKCCGRDPRFQLIRCGDCKPGIARNFGIEEVKAPYISFADSDDIMHKDMLKSLYDAAEKENADIAVCDFDMVYIDRTINSFAKVEDYYTSINEKNLAKYYFKFSAAPKPNNYVWARLYKKEFLDDTKIRFQNVRYSEDHLFNLMLLCQNPRISHVGKALYDYIQRDNSAMRQHVRSTNHGELFLDAFNQARENLERQNKIYTEPILAIYAYTRIKSILFYANQASLKEPEIKKALKSFSSDGRVNYYLNLCIRKGYFTKYCKIHGYSDEWRENAQEIIRACINNDALGDVSRIF